MIDGVRMPLPRAILPALIVVWSLAAARPARAQEIVAGYSYLTDASSPLIRAISEHNMLPAGWMAGAAWPIRSWLAGVAEISSHHTTLHTLDADVTLSFRAYMAGARVSAPIGPLVEFGQLLAGVVAGRGSAFGATIADRAFALQPGAGIDIPIRGRLLARAEIDSRLINGSAEGRQRTRQFRAVAAVVYRR
jgi:hypothetical protein